MTPEQAQDMLSRAQVDGELGLTAEMAARAPFMAEQIAHMHYEYAVQIKDREPASWWKDLAIARGEMEEIRKAWPERVHNFRIVRRLVSAPEAVE